MESDATPPPDQTIDAPPAPLPPVETMEAPPVTEIQFVFNVDSTDDTVNTFPAPGQNHATLFRHSTPERPTTNFNADEPAASVSVVAEAPKQRPSSAEREPKKRSLLRDIVLRNKLGASGLRPESILAHPAASISALPITDSGEHIAVPEPASPTSTPVSPLDTKSARLLNLTLRLMTPRKKMVYASTQKNGGGIKSSNALTANFGSTNLHLNYKSTISGSSVLSPDFRNGLTGRKVNDNLATSTSNGTTASTSTQNRNLHRPSTLRTGTILGRRESSLLELIGGEATERQVSLTLSTLYLTPGIGTRSHMPVASHNIGSR
ncbi:UNVERIFIED_CONTAM: hypothetical protein HDU68_012947, partial [Siphonaria sp. JEL0065]